MKKIILVLALFIVHCTFNIENCEGQWVQKSNGLPANIIVGNFIGFGSNLFAATNMGVYLSSNNGDNWIFYSNGLPNNEIYWFAAIGNNLFVATDGAGVYKSTNNGVNWVQKNSGLTDPKAIRLAVKGTDLYCGTYNEGIFCTTNNGDNWSKCLSVSRIYSLYAMGNNLFAGTNYNGIYRSTNNGVNWVGVNNGISFSVRGGFTSFGNNLFAGTLDGGVFLTTNNGDNWNPVNSGYVHNNLTQVISKDSTLFAGSGSGGMFISINKGGNWAAINQGFSSIPGINSLYIYNNYIFVGTSAFAGPPQGVWRRNLSDFIGIKNISSEIPSKYSLSQNYPNPFNPSSIIRFQIKDSRFVSLKVYDMLGKEVATLVNEKLAPGTYEASFDARHGGSSSLTSGVYFYSLETQSYKETKRMILIK